MIFIMNQLVKRFRVGDQEMEGFNGFSDLWVASSRLSRESFVMESFREEKDIEKEHFPNRHGARLFPEDCKDLGTGLRDLP